ncbi:MAG: hypothetical protein U0903_16935 [Planctomycetales bacterium]
MLRNFCVPLCRICITAWVGAAVLFVMVAIKPVRSPALDSLTKSRLVIELFPGYYTIGFSLLIVGVLAGLITWTAPTSGRAYRAGVILALLGLLAMTVDWFTIYKPLEQMIHVQLSEGTAPPAEFRSYHIASWIINAVSVGLCALAVPCLHRNKQPAALPSK